MQSAPPAAAEGAALRLDLLRHTMVSLLVVCVITISFWFTDLTEYSLRSLSVGSLCVGLLAFCYVSFSSSRGFWSIPSLFLLVVICFHLGALPFAAAGMRPQFASNAVGAWYGEAATRQAVLVVTAAIAMLAIGSGGSRTRLQKSQPRVRISSARDADRFGLAGLAVLTLAVAVWVAQTASTLGATFFLSSYQRYTRSTDGSTLLPFVFYGIGLGVVIVCASSSRAWFRPALIVFALFAAMALPLGLRGEVLFPATAGAAMFARRHKMPRAGFALIIVLGVLTGINALQQVRQTGLGDLNTRTLSATPLEGLAELGGTSADSQRGHLMACR